VAVRPARLPAIEAELADWSVYADQLQQEGDPLGEMIAFDLALPARPTEEAIADYQQRFKKRCWTHRQTVEVVWALGYARSLGFRRDRTSMSSTIDDGTLANARDFLRSEAGGVLEELVLIFSGSSRPMERMLAALPATCTHVLAFDRWRNEHQLVEMITALPRHVTHVSLSSVPRLSPEAARILVDDRFEQVTIRRADRAPLETALDSTERVRVKLAAVAGRLEHPRCVWAGGADAGLVDIAARRASVVHNNTDTFATQRRFGLIPIRAQLERSLAVPDDILMGQFDVRIVRRGPQFTMWSERALHVDGVRVEPRTVAAVQDGARIKGEGIDAIFLTHDLDQRYRELVQY
jgi:hypothetical protein